MPKTAIKDGYNVNHNTKLLYGGCQRAIATSKYIYALSKIKRNKSPEIILMPVLRLLLTRDSAILHRFTLGHIAILCLFSKGI